MHLNVAPRPAIFLFGLQVKGETLELRSSPAQPILSASFCMELLRGGFVAAFHPLDSTSLIAVPSINVLANLNAPAYTTNGMQAH